MKKGLLIFTAGFGIFLLMVAAAYALFLTWPEVIIHSKNAEWLRARYLGKLVSWEQLEVSLESESFFRKRLNLAAAGLRVDSDSLQLRDGKLDTALTLNLNPFNLSLLAVENTAVQIEEVALLSTPEEEKSSEPIDLKSYYDWISEVQFAPVSLAIASLKVAGEAEVAEWQLQAYLTGLNRSDTDRLSLKVSGLEATPIKELDAQIRLSDYLKDPRQAVFQGQISIDASDYKVNGQMKLSATDAGGERDFQSDWTLRDGFGSVDLELLGQVSAERYTGGLSVAARQWSESRLSFSLKPCDLTLRWGDFFNVETSGKLSCEGLAEPHGFVSQSYPQASLDQIPSQLIFALAAEISEPERQEGKALQTKGYLDIEEFRVSSAHASGKMSFDLVVPGAAEASYDLGLSYDFEVSVRKFQQLVSDLKDSSLAIPAPLNQLSGQIDCQSSGHLEMQKSQEAFDLKCLVDLASQDQKLKARAQGPLMLRQKGERFLAQLDLGVEIEDLVVVLPSLNLLESPPQLVPDQRFILEREETASPKQEETFFFSYKLSLKTLRKDSLLISSNLSSQPIPVSLDLQARSGHPLLGFVRVNPFEFEVLRRVAKVEQIEVQWLPGSEDQKLDGLIFLENNDYKITIKIFGTTDKPNYSFESEPPLPERDLIALVLFNKEPGSLSEAEMKSSDDAKAALAEGAISLLSMYYLASTPVESVGYDPYSGVFTARVSLAEGLTLSVGTDTDRQTRVGLRKRLGGGWSIETKAEKSSDSEGRKGVALLKWGARF